MHNRHGVGTPIARPFGLNPGRVPKPKPKPIHLRNPAVTITVQGGKMLHQDLQAVWLTCSNLVQAIPSVVSPLREKRLPPTAAPKIVIKRRSELAGYRGNLGVKTQKTSQPNAQK